MNRLIAALLTLLAFAVFCFFCIRMHAPMIQHDIMSKTAEALSASAIPSSGVSVNGRDVLLSGVAGSLIVSDQTRGMVSALPGVRVADVQIADSKATSTTPTSDMVPDAKVVVAKKESQQKLDAVLQTRIVEFNTGSAELTTAGRETLDQIVPILSATPGLLCNINGYTDNTGVEQDNLNLSERRAQASKSYLESKGIDPARLTAQGFGDANPVASNETLEGRHRNRRIEFLLTEKK